MAAVQQDGQALAYASEEMRGDKDVVLAALKQDGYALRYVSYKVRLDAEVVRAAVEQTGVGHFSSLCNDYPKIREDKEVVLTYLGAELTRSVRMELLPAMAELTVTVK